MTARRGPVSAQGRGVMVETGSRVVIADDDDDFRYLLAQMLELYTHSTVVAHAASAEDAIRAVRRSKPDVVLLDLRLPGTGVLDTIAEVRRAWPASRVILLSGLSREHREVQEALTAADDYVEKGSRRDELLAALQPRERPAVETGTAQAAAIASSAGLQRVSDPSTAEALHDGPVQSLAGALWMLDSMEAAVDDPATQRDLVVRLRRSLTSALEALRALVEESERAND